MQKDQIIIYGRNPVNEVAETYPHLVQQIWVADTMQKSELDHVRIEAKRLKIPFATVGEKYLKQKVGNDVVHQGVAARLREFPYVELEDWMSRVDLSTRPAVLVLDELQDPHNVGAIIRSAAAFGFAAVLLPKHRQVGVTSTVVKTSAGAVFHVPIIKIGNVRQTLELLKSAGFWSAALASDGSDALAQAVFDTPMAFVIGSEGTGVRQQTREVCDFTYRIPMHGNVESLNASVSAAVVMYEWARQQ